MARDPTQEKRKFLTSDEGAEENKKSQVRNKNTIDVCRKLASISLPARRGAGQVGQWLPGATTRRSTLAETQDTSAAGSGDRTLPSSLELLRARVPTEGRRGAGRGHSQGGEEGRGKHEDVIYKGLFPSEALRLPSRPQSS